MHSFHSKPTNPYATSFRRRFFSYHSATRHPHTNIFLSLFIIPLVLKCATNILKSINKNLTSKNVPERDFAQAREIIQTSLTLDSGKRVDFIQTFGHLVSFSYNLVLVLCILNKILKLLIFSGKIVISLGNNTGTYKNSYSKTFLETDFQNVCGTF